MIPRTYGRIGEPVCFEGTACILATPLPPSSSRWTVASNWTTYPTPGTNDYQNVAWRFDYVPKKAGLHVLKVRSVNDEGKESPEADFAELLVE